MPFIPKMISVKETMKDERSSVKSDQSNKSTKTSNSTLVTSPFLVHQIKTVKVGEFKEINDKD
jgi:hypothetical protein